MANSAELTRARKILQRRNDGTMDVSKAQEILEKYKIELTDAEIEKILGDDGEVVVSQKVTSAIVEMIDEPLLLPDIDAMNPMEKLRYCQETTLSLFAKTSGALNAQMDRFIDGEAVFPEIMTNALPKMQKVATETNGIKQLIDREAALKTLTSQGFFCYRTSDEMAARMEEQRARIQILKALEQRLSLAAKALSATPEGREALEILTGTMLEIEAVETQKNIENEDE